MAEKSLCAATAGLIGSFAGNPAGETQKTPPILMRSSRSRAHQNAERHHSAPRWKEKLKERVQRLLQNLKRGGCYGPMER